MLKTLKVTSLILAIAAGCIVVVLIVFALRGNPDIQAFLERPGVVERFKDNIDSKSDQKDVSSPLVSQARAFALRIDPPPPPPPPRPKDSPPPEVARTQPTVRPLPTPKVQVSNKFDLLATVKYEADPEKSLALLKTTDNQQEWFRQGDMVGNMKLTEVKDGSVVFSQGNTELPEVFVPVKPQVTSLLKGDAAAGLMPSRADSIGIETPSSSPSGGQPALSDAVERARAAAAARSRTAGTPSPSRTDVSSRIQRLRSVPRQPSPAERQESLESTISGIEDIMNRQDVEISEEEHQREKELWMSLMEKIQAEKENVDTQVESEGESQGTPPDASSEDSEAPRSGEPNDS